ncbi:MAG: (d)CMP kinase [candidate division WOR-3 bacterium]
MLLDHITNMLIAIDGPAGSGKSAIAKKLSEILKIKYVETGALYRAIAYYILKNNIKEFGNFEFLKDIKLEQKFINQQARTFLNGEDITEKIRNEEIGNFASIISKYKEVREFLLDIQRELAKDGAILEGRDIGTVVLPNADFKFFITASVEERARRRYEQLKDKNKSYEEILEQLKQRDKMDLERSIAPLRISREAFIIDTTDMSEDEVIEEILRIINENLKVGTVISKEGKKLSVFSNNRTFMAIPRGKVIKKYERIYVGDIVIGKIENNMFVIEDIRERKNVLLRPPVANISKAILLFTIVEPEFVQIHLDKLLCAYEYYNVNSLIVFNKIDITPKEELEKIVKIYSECYDVVLISVKENYNLDLLKEKVRGDLVVLSGPSGVGKSSLIKALTGLDIRIGEVSQKIKRGTQTTTEVKLYPIDNETLIIDTPGFSKLDLKLIMKKEDVRNCFREFKNYKCAFRDCLHIKEEGCAIREAVNEGKINRSRYLNYLKIMDEF